MAILPTPLTPEEERVELIHGVAVRDPYRWLEDGSAERVRAWTAAQVQRTRAYLDSLPVRHAVASRLRDSLDCGTLGVIVPRGPWRFFTRRTAGMDQAALYVLEDGRERLLVDPAPLSPDGATAIDWWYPSPSGNLVAYGISEAGDEDSELQVLETGTGRTLPDRIPRCRLASVAFEAGERSLLYTRLPLAGEVAAGEEQYHRRVFRHVLGSGAESDEQVFARERKTDYPGGISVSAEGRWTVVNVAIGWGEGAVALRESGQPFCVIFEVPGKEAFAWFAGDRLLAITNLDAPNYRLVEIDPAQPDPGLWRDVVAESDSVLLDAKVSAGGILAHHLDGCASRLTLLAPDGAVLGRPELPAPCSVTGIGAASDLHDVFVAVETFTRPSAVSRVTADASLDEVMALSPPAGFEGDRYPVRQVFCESADGTRVPMFLVGRPAGEGTTVLTGYGGFNVVKAPVWTPSIVPLLERGGLYALANLRGGAEFGERWHREGMRDKKQRTFDDFIAAGRWLIENGLTRPSQLGITGRSNGGLLVGAAMTQRPDLWGAVWCGVPLLDMVRYERFQVAQLWAAEYGSAAVPEEFSWLYAYSPYHRVRAGTAYPPLLLTTADADTRVDPMHARKFAALLQAASPGSLTLLRVDERAGHGLGKPASKLVEEEADAWAFLLSFLEDGAIVSRH